MAAGTRQNNTMSEGLRKLLGDIADLKLADDADLPFLIQIETQILGRLKNGVDQALDPSQSAQPGMMSAPGGMPGQGSPPGVPGLMQGPSMPNGDELRRMLGRASTASRLSGLSSRIAGL